LSLRTPRPGQRRKRFENFIISGQTAIALRLEGKLVEAESVF